MLNEYRKMINDALDTIDQITLSKIFAAFNSFHKFPVIVFGNGGSAAIADHWTCDHMKGCRTDTNMKSQVRNLAANMSLITAIANDINYDQIFSKQIEWCNENEAIVLAISSSGNSPNIINGLKAANKKGYSTIAIVGFNGGAVVKEDLADYIIHIKSNNYGVVEDCTQMLMHVIAQNLRKNNTEKDISTLKL